MRYFYCEFSVFTFVRFSLSLMLELLVKIKSKEKQLNFANLAIQEFCDDIELDMNDVNAMLYACAKIVEFKLGVKPKEKRKPDKNVEN